VLQSAEVSGSEFAKIRADGCRLTRLVGGRLGARERRGVRTMLPAAGAWLACFALLLALVGVPAATAGGGQTSASSSRAAVSATPALVAQASLRSGVLGRLAAAVKPDRGGRQLGATFGSRGVAFDGAAFAFGVGVGSVGRGGNATPVAGRLVRQAHGATFGGGPVSESFRSTPAGIEESFHLAQRLAGRGPVQIDVPVSGLTAVSDGQAIDLRDKTGTVRATYTGLRVTDAAHRLVDASMGAGSHGRSVVIDIVDASAIYPLTVDPTWSQVSEPTSSDGAAGDGFGSSVAVWGATAVVGAPAHAVSGHAAQGAAYVFGLSGSTWSQTAELTSSDGAASDGFGSSVAVSGSTVVVGAAAHAVAGHAGQGAAYVFTCPGAPGPRRPS
jgi:hypothetical protein